MAVKIDDVLDYLKDWHSAGEIEKEFNLSNSERHHLLRWLVKGKYIVRISGKAYNQMFNTNVDERQEFYKVLKD